MEPPGAFTLCAYFTASAATFFAASSEIFFCVSTCAFDMKPINNKDMIDKINFVFMMYVYVVEEFFLQQFLFQKLILRSCCFRSRFCLFINFYFFARMFFYFFRPMHIGFCNIFFCVFIKKIKRFFGVLQN